MVCSVAFTPGYSLIQQIIPRSMCSHLRLSLLMVVSLRVLMTSIRNMGGCPCPRCKIPMGLVDMIGTSSDHKLRQDMKRHDDATRQQAVALARDAIFQKNFAVDSAYVERQLKDESFVPSFVSRRHSGSRRSIICFRMHFPTGCQDLVLIYSQFFPLIFCMKLS